MATRTLLARASVSIFLAVSILPAAQNYGEAQEAGKVGPPLETVKAFATISGLSVSVSRPKAAYSRRRHPPMSALASA